MLSATVMGALTSVRAGEISEAEGVDDYAASPASRR